MLIDKNVPILGPKVITHIEELGEWRGSFLGFVCECVCSDLLWPVKWIIRHHITAHGQKKKKY